MAPRSRATAELLDETIVPIEAVEFGVRTPAAKQRQVLLMRSASDKPERFVDLLIRHVDILERDSCITQQ